MQRIRVEDVVLQTVVTLVNLAGARLDGRGRGEGPRPGQAGDRGRAALCPAARRICAVEAVAGSDAVSRRRLSQLQMLGTRRRPREQGEAPRRAPRRRRPRSAPRPGRRSGRRPGLERRPSGVFGGSGFYRFLDDVEEVAVDTPYGPPSARIRLGEIEGTRVAFMPRHGDEHTLPPHRINYRANVWAMRAGGRHADRRPLAPAARSSPSSSPGTFVVCDQFVDRTRGREDTFYDGPQTTPRLGRRPLLPRSRRPWSTAARRRRSRWRTAGRWW